ncbi:hypothetical protein GRI75_05600 [Altererythrobacter soli]|uniref:Uncharacterized protein n=1 Tax=Croceibacterium soli TaxID=1739690 RepID=A0A6I4UQ63_9SPHN|nr:hypothetical protein [Croceibacterium soli]MXP41120.1 hypothetical protein [Croceibacterium soli]
MLLAGACFVAAPSGDPWPRALAVASGDRSAPAVATTAPSADQSALAPVEAAMIRPLPVAQKAPPSVSGAPAAEVMPRPSALPVLAMAEPAAQPPPSEPVVAEDLVFASEPLRPVDIEQIADSEARSLRMAQLREPGLAGAGAPTLAARVDAMQVTLPPPPRLRDTERAALLAESPSNLLVRIGESELGKVALRTSDAQSFDVQLSGLLDLLVERFDSSEFERLRSSAAADTFVSFDQLRAMGLNLRYDPVYDELRITS